MERDREARGMNAHRQELLQSGLSLSVNSSSTENRRKEEGRPADGIFTLGSSSLKSRLADARLVSFGGEKGDGTVGEKVSRRDADNNSGLDDRRSANTTLQYDPRVDAVRAVSQMSLQSDGASLSLHSSSTPSRPLFRPGNMVQRSSAHSGLPPNISHSNEALQKPFSKDPSPKPQESPIGSPKRSILEHGPPVAPPQNLKLGQRRRTPNLREGKGMMPSAPEQQQTLQRQSHLQQQTMQRQGHLQQQVLDSRESKGVMSSGNMQQSSLQQQSLQHQQQTLQQQIFDPRDSKGMMSVGGPQQLAMQQQQAALQQQAAEARESKGMLSARSTQHQAMQQQVAFQQLARHNQSLEARENKGVMSPGSPQQQALQQQHAQHVMHQQQQQHALQFQALQHRVFDGRDSKGLMPAGVTQQHLSQQTPVQQNRQQVLDSRDSKGMSAQQQASQHAMQQQVVASQQQARHQQVSDGRESKGMIPSGGPQQHALQLQPILEQKSLQQQGRQQQVLESRETKGMMSAGSPQQQSLLQQTALGLHQQALNQQIKDARESKGVMHSGNSQKQGVQQPSIQQQHSLQQQPSLQQQTSSQQQPPSQQQPSLQQQPSSQQQQQPLHHQVLDVRENKGLMLPGSPQQQQASQQQSTIQLQSVHQQVMDNRENKAMMPSGSSQQQALLLQSTLHQKAHHQQGLESRDNKGMLTSGAPLQQTLQQQALQQALDARENKGVVLTGTSPLQALQQQQHAFHQQIIEARESKGTMSAGTPQQQALYQQGIDVKESKGIGAGSPKQQGGQQQLLHQQPANTRDTRSPQSMTAQQQAVKQGLDARESNGMIPPGSAQHQSMQQLISQKAIQQAIHQQALHQQQGRHQQLLEARESKIMVPGGSSQRQALHAAQQHALHQQALNQFQQVGSLQGAPSHPPQGLHLSDAYKTAYQQSQRHNSEQLNIPQRSGTLHLRGAYLASQPKVEPVELEGIPSADRPIVDRAKLVMKSSPEDSTSPKESVSVAEVDEAIQFGLKKMNTEESKPSISFGSAAESKDSVRSGSRREGGEGRHPHSQSSGRTSRETMFADLNAAPPASDGEDEGPVPSDGVQTMAQPESSRTTTEEKRKRKKALKDPKSVKEGEEVDNKKARKPAKPRTKPKGEMNDSGLEGDGDNHLTGVPTTKEEKIKSLKMGLVQAARKLPKNAHAHFSLGLMHQRWQNFVKAGQAFKQAADILKQLEEETGQQRGQLLATIHVHHAQCLLQGTLQGHLGPGKELEKEELEKVVSKLKEATILDSGQASVWSTLGLLLLRSGRIQSSIHVMLALLEIVPDQVDCLANLGVAYLRSGELEHATRCFQFVLDKDKTHPGALINYATLLLRQYGSSFSGAGSGAGPGAYATRVTAARAAQQCLEAALKDDPKAAHIWANLAAVYSTLGDINGASQCLEQAIKLEPERMSTRYAVAAHRVKDAERSDDANEQLGWAANEMASILREGDFTSIQPRLAWGGLAMVNRAQHETAAAFEGGGVDLKEVEERALHTLQQAIEEDPADAVQWHQMGLHTLCTLQFSAAQRYLKTAISRRWANPSAWSNLGIALQLSEDPALAEGVYKQALAIAPQEQAHSIYSNLGNLYRQQKKFSEAHDVFKKALDLCPEYAPACNNLGLLLVAEGKWEDAIATFNRSLRADPFLDAAKSNRMKAEALFKMRENGSQVAAVPSTSLPAEAVVKVDAVENVSIPVENAVIPVSSVSAQSPAPVEPTQREPFPLPSIS